MHRGAKGSCTGKEDVWPGPSDAKPQAITTHLASSTVGSPLEHVSFSLFSASWAHILKCVTTVSSF